MTESLPKPFVLLNIPKTGSMYVAATVRNADLLSLARRPALRDALSRSPRMARALLKMLVGMRRLHILRFGYMNPWEHHTFHCRLPGRLHACPAVSVLRDPLSWHVSRYLYTTSLKKGGYPFIYKNLQAIDRLLHAPQEPQHESAALFLKQHLGGKLTPQAWGALSVEGFYYFMRNFFRFSVVKSHFSVTVPPSFPLSILGCRAMMFVHREPGRLFAMSPEEVEEYFADGRWRRDLIDALFLRFEKLQEDLRCVMLEHLDYDREVLDAAARLTPARINVSNPARKERALRELEQKPQLREEILRDERLYVEHVLPLAGAFRND